MTQKLSDSLSSSNYRILAVEDDDLLQAFLQDTFSSLGYEVVVEADAQGALQALLVEKDFSLLFTDVDLPDQLNGRELADRARELYPDLPVIFTSGDSTDATLNRRIEEGTEHFIQKPYRRSTLAEIVACALSRYKD